MNDMAGPVGWNATTRTRAARTDPDVRREQIVDAATELLRRHRFADITMRMLQEHLGLSKGGVYHYVGSKDDILLLVCEQAATAMLGTLHAAQELDGPARAKLERLVAGHLATVNTYGGALWAFSAEREKLQHERQLPIVRLEREYLRGIVALLRAAQEAGEVRADEDPRLLADALLGMINWFVRWRSPGRAREKELSAAFTRIFADATLLS